MKFLELLDLFRHNMNMQKDLAFNKRAIFDYEILENFEAGLSLLGTEVKSIKAGHMSLKGAFVTIHNGEAYLTNATVPPWQIKNAPSDYDPVRARRLLLKKSELDMLVGARQEQGLTIIPIRVYNGRFGKVKLQLALAKGKKQYNKREAKKEQDIARDVQRVLRGKDY
jgi:SsrA-binding protein